MASIPRYLVLDNFSSFHITWQIHNKQNYFKTEYYKKKYYLLMLENKAIYNILIFSYCIMDTHVHFTGFSEDNKKVSLFMKKVNSTFARYYNKQEGKRGQVCMDRFKSPVIHTDVDMLNVMKYIDLNPVNACMIDDPRNYKYSSYNHYAYGTKDPLIDECPAYLNLGATDLERQKKYREMVNEIIETEQSETSENQEKKYDLKLYIGDPEWVIQKYKDLKNKLNDKKHKLTG